MTYIITYGGEAVTDIGSLDPTARDQTLKKLYEVASSEYRGPQQFDVKPLQGAERRWRLRVGDDIRVVLEIEHKTKCLNVFRVGRRENFY